MSALLLATLLAPLALAPVAVAGGRLRATAQGLAGWSMLPALAAAVLIPSGSEIDVPWLLLGARFGVDLVGRVFLVFTVVLWIASGVYARAYLAEDPGRGRFFGYYLAAAGGNLLLIVAQDLATFYLFFTLMTFSAYGLIVHSGGGDALRAGRIYIALALVGEALLLVGGLLVAVDAPSLALPEVAATLAASPRRDLAMALLFGGFAVKAGIVPVHVWLPLAHPVAPTPASAVLSGAMVAAGLLGWIRLLPLGGAAFPEWGAALVLIGLATAFWGAAVGLAQDDPKTILAYSSVSQMGIMCATFGIGLLHPSVAPAALGAVLLFAVHHGLVKGALFLGIGVVAARSPGGPFRYLVPAGLIFAALAMAGAPLTSGSLAKHWVTEAAHLTPGGWAHRLDLLLPLTVVGTALLMARFLQRTLASTGSAPHQRLQPRLWGPWLALLLAGAGALWILPARVPIRVGPPALPGASELLDASWPILLGAAIYGGARLLATRAPLARLRIGIPAGDVLVPLERVARPLWQPVEKWKVERPPDPVEWVALNWYGVYARRDSWPALRRVERMLARWGTAGLLYFLVGVVLLALLFAAAR